MFGGIGKIIRKWFEGTDGRGVPDILTEEEIARTVAAEDTVFPAISRTLEELGKDLEKTPVWSNQDQRLYHWSWDPVLDIWSWDPELDFLLLTWYS